MAASEIAALTPHAVWDVGVNAYQTAKSEPAATAAIGLPLLGAIHVWERFKPQIANRCSRALVGLQAWKARLMGSAIPACPISRPNQVQIPSLGPIIMTGGLCFAGLELWQVAQNIPQGGSYDIANFRLPLGTVLVTTFFLKIALSNRDSRVGKIATFLCVLDDIPPVMNVLQQIL